MRFAGLVQVKEQETAVVVVVEEEGTSAHPLKGAFQK